MGCAMVFLEVARRQVLAIRNIDYYWLQFNGKGRIDKKEWEKGMRLGMELLPSIACQESVRLLLWDLSYSLNVWA